MPANLNALLRYKTINSCLHGGTRRWSIGELIEACTNALADARGRYGRISERTIRDDIRVMRSDILGFNAPIKQKNGLYFYTDPHYSILSLSLTDSELIGKMIRFLLDIRKDVNHPELEIILNKLVKMSGEQLPEKPDVKKPAAAEPDEFMTFEIPVQSMVIRKYMEGPVKAEKIRKAQKLLSRIPGRVPKEKHEISADLLAISVVTWGDILGILK